MTQKPETIIDRIEKEEGVDIDGETSRDASTEADGVDSPAPQSPEAAPPEAAAAEASSPGQAAPEAGQTSSTADTGEVLEQKEKELAALEERFLRQAADFQNFKKRALEERALSIDIGRTQVAMPMIEVLDDLRRSLEAADQAGRSEASAYHALRDGVKLVFEKFETELARIGIKPMETLGIAFDEEKHEALLQQPAPPGTDTGTILAEIQKGYTIGDRVLRHARVVVAT
jgi:molecular chaperone GrpE